MLSNFDFAVANSVDIARGMTRQVPLKLIYIMETLHDSEALVVHNNWKYNENGRIFRPRDLEGKIVGAWWGSSAHYSLQRFARATSTELMYDTRYQFNQSCGGTVPCFWDVACNLWLVACDLCLVACGVWFVTCALGFAFCFFVGSVFPCRFDEFVLCWFVGLLVC